MHTRSELIYCFTVRRARPAWVDGSPQAENTSHPVADPPGTGTYFGALGITRYPAEAQPFKLHQCLPADTRPATVTRYQTSQHVVQGLDPGGTRTQDLAHCTRCVNQLSHPGCFPAIQNFACFATLTPVPPSEPPYNQKALSPLICSFLI